MRTLFAVGVALLSLVATASHAQDASAPPVPSDVVAPAPVPEKPANSVAADGTVTTPSGLSYRDTKLGTGAEAQTGNAVSVHYTGWLQAPKGKKGKKFDSSLDRHEPIKFTLGTGRVIKGWEEGITGMRVGGKRRLVIPPQLAYGDRNVGGGLIPPGSSLIFEVELVATETMPNTQ